MGNNHYVVLELLLHKLKTNGVHVVGSARMPCEVINLNCENFAENCEESLAIAYTYPASARTCSPRPGALELRPHSSAVKWLLHAQRCNSPTAYNSPRRLTIGTSY